MAIIKCKMCGGDLEIVPEVTVAECEYCGTKQTVPTVDNEKKVTLFSRANRLRFGCEFDKAAGVYESIVAEFHEEAEAYWGLVLCKYGIEYVDDPATARKIPTCHRSSFDSVMDDSNFELVMEYSDAASRRVYRDEAKTIEELRKGIIEISGKEDPYDIFICYKETDEVGGRTLDSVIAQDIYDALTEKGYRVFFSRITLEDKLGQEYEPYIFAALHSAKIMLAVGTDYEYYNAVWVKNEWSRFLQLIASGEKKTLIPCFKNLDAYDMPKEFARLQAQDMGKVGAMQDLLRGIEKIIGVKVTPEAATQQSVVIQQVVGGSNVQSLLDRGNMALEDGEWEKADGFFEEVLNQDAKCAEAYLGKLMVELCVHTREELKTCKETIEERSNYKKAIRFGKGAIKKELQGIVRYIKESELEAMYSKAIEAMNCAKAASHLLKVADQFRAIVPYKDSDMLMKQCEEKATQLKEEFCRLATERRTLNKYMPMIFTGDSNTLGLKVDGTVVAVGSNAYGNCDVSDWNNIKALAAGEYHTVGLKNDGTVVAVGDNKHGQCDVAEWNDLVAIAAGRWHTVGLKNDGTVIVTGNEYDLYNVSSWTDVVSISAGSYYIVGLKADGTVLTAGKDTVTNSKCDVSDWSRITAIATGDHVVGLKADGTVVATGDNTYGQCEVSTWSDIISIYARDGHTIGLRADGTVMAAGCDDYCQQYDVSDWADILEVSGNTFAILGLKMDGTVVATGLGECSDWDVSKWCDIVAVSASPNHGVGLKSDGTVVSVGNNFRGRCEVSEWRLFQSYETLEQERESARIYREREKETARIREEQEKEAARIREEQEREADRIRQEQEQLKVSRRLRGLCQHCGGKFKGLFSKTCASCGKPKDY